MGASGAPVHEVPNGSDQMLYRDVVIGGWVGFSPPGIWIFRKKDRKQIDNLSITISPLRFENLTTSLL